jgi:hypothetical protein
MTTTRTKLQLIGVPAASFIAGGGIGFTGRRVADKERKRVKIWRGKDGAFIVVREPKAKTAAVLNRAFAYADNPGQVADSFEDELEKIAFVGPLLQAGKSLFGVGRQARSAARLSRMAQPSGRAIAGRRAAKMTGLPGTPQANIRRVHRPRPPAMRPDPTPDYSGMTPRQVSNARIQRGRPAANAKAQVQSVGPKPGMTPSVNSPLKTPNSITGVKPQGGQSPGMAPSGPVALGPQKAPLKGPNSVSGAKPQGTTDGQGSGILPSKEQASAFMGKHFGLTPGAEGGMMGGKGAGDWFEGLTREQRIKILGTGAAGIGLVGLTGGAMLGGGGNTTVVRS